MTKRLDLSTFQIGTKLIARIAECTPVSIGCFCSDESRCHRSRLYKILLQQAASENR